MKSIFTLLLALCFWQQANAAGEFVTRWNLATAGSGATQLTFGTTTAGSVSYTWTTVPAGTSGSGSWTGSTLTITGLPSGATIDLSISPTNFQRININNGTDRNRLIDVSQWGTTTWTTMSGAFYGCRNLNISATDIPVLTSCTDMQSMFRSCTVLNGPSNINSWNTGTVTNMAFMFTGASVFNQNIGSLDVSKVTDMQSMFLFAAAFNQNIGGWNVSKVNKMQAMFQSDSMFNQNIGSWDVSNVTNMNNMFNAAISFNNLGSGTIGGWDVSKVTDMNNMFNAAKTFNQDIGSWNTGAVTNMSNMFATASVFNQNIGSWDVRKVTNMSSMFSFANKFNNLGSGTIGSLWDVSKVTDMQSMFQSASSFNQNIGSWSTGVVTNMTRMFFGASVFNQDIGGWSTGAVTNMSLMFQSASAFNQNIGSWSTGAVINMSSMFQSATAFNQNIGSWDVSKVTDMSNMFASATAFNNLGSGAIGIWDVKKVTNMSHMFDGASVFNQNISSWIPSAVTNMSFMFAADPVFNQNIGSWDVSKVTNMSFMFNGCYGFKNLGSPLIGSWDVSKVTNMNGMFNFAVSFNQPIGSWNTGAVTNMSQMFNQASAFNQNIGGWNTGAVTNMSQMFAQTSAFNQNIGGWNTGAVTNMNSMFLNATAFNQNIGSWNIANVTNMTNMLDNSGMNILNYDALLNAWSLASHKTGVTLGALNLKYCNGVNAKNKLIADGLTPVNDVLGCAPGGVVSTTIQYWLKANTSLATDGAALTQWNDDAGKGNHFTQSTAANQPSFSSSNAINFNPVMSFDGSNDYLSASPILPPTTYYGVVAASRTSSSDSSASLKVANSLLGSTRAWLPATASSAEYITLDLGAVRPIDGITTVGRTDLSNWTKTYSISYSTDGVAYTPMGLTFTGNTDMTTQVTNVFAATVHARYIRVFPQTWNVWPALRLDVFTKASLALESFVVSKEAARQDNDLLRLSYSTAADQLSMTAANASGNMLYKGLYSPNAASSYNMSVASPVAVGTPTISSFTNSATANLSKMYSDGTLKSSSVGAYMPIIGNQSLGGLSTGSNFKGQIAEVITYLLAPTDLQLLTTHSYLAIKYGITMSQDQNGNGTKGQVISGAITEGDYVAANASTVFWKYSTRTGFYNRVFGLGRDDNQGLNQQIATSQNAGSILTLSTDNNFTSNSGTHTAIANNISFAMVGDDNAALSETTTNLPTSFATTYGCNTNRLSRQWKTQLTNFDNTTQAVGLQFNLTGLTVTGTLAAHFKLIIDADGDGNFTTGAITTVNATSFASNLVTFQGVTGLVDGAVFALVTNANTLTPVLVASGTSVTSPTNCIKSGIINYNNSYVDNIILKLDKNGNTITPTSVKVNNEGTLISAGTGTFSNTGTGYYQMTDGLNTIRLTKRLHTVVAPGTFTTGGGVKVRVYYSAADTTNMLSDAWPGAGTLVTSGWFKHRNHSAQEVVDSMKAGGLKNADAITPIAYGTESGILYAEFLVTSFSTFGFMAATTATPLPIKLLSFDAVKLGNNAAVLNWATGSEVNAKQFDINRSVDGKIWLTIGTVAAKGSNSQYSLVDNKPQYGNNYYRLQMQDIDGSLSYSPVRVLNFGSTTAGFKVYPNPASEMLQIDLQGKSVSNNYELVDVLGRVALEGSLNANTNNKLDVSGLAQGVYMLKVQTETGVQTQQVQIAK